MKRILHISKRIVALVLIVAMCQTSFAAVGANDGSAFITKAEFDAIVNTFNEQMDNYELNLISKIDGAIANYLASMETRSSAVRNIIYTDAKDYGVLCINKDNPLDYKYGFPVISGVTMMGFNTNGTTTAYAGASAQRQKFTQIKNDNSKVNKTTITNLYANKTTTSNSTAEFNGYYEDGYDYVYCAGYKHEGSTTSYVNSSWQRGYWALCGAYNIKDKNLVGSMGWIGYFKDFQASGTSAGPNGGAVVALYVNAITHDWGKLKYKYLSVMSNYDYNMFSNYDRDYNWGYDGSYITEFNGYKNKETLATKSGAKLNAYGECMSRTDSTLMYMKGGTFYNPTSNYSTFRTDAQFYTSSLPSNTVYVPMVGFEEKYLTNWKQIYLTGTNSIAESEYKKSTAVKGLLLDEKGKRHLSLAAGFPLVEINKGETFEYEVKFKDTSKNYTIWVSKRPFDPETHPDDNTNCIELNDVPLAKNCTRGYSIVSGSATFKTNEIKEDCVLYIKFGISNTDKTKVAGGLLMPAESGTVYFES